MAKFSHYALAEIADQDLVDIYEYTEKEFGQDQAVTYLLSLEAVLNGLLENPLLGKERNEIKNGLRGFTHKEHVIFYRILEKHIRIVRVLHGSRDLPIFLK